MFENIFKHKILESNESVSVIGLNTKVQAFYVWDLFRVSKQNVLVVTNTLYEANNLYKSLSYYDEKKVLLFPMDDFIASEALASSPELMSKRIDVLNELIFLNDRKIIITNLMGYLRFLPDNNLWKTLNINLKKGDVISRDDLIEKLLKIGYQKESLVTKTGEFSNRGYVLDIFPFGYDNPIRLEFFDDEIESIREYDPNSQLSTGRKDQVNIMPFTEFINEKNIEDVPSRQSLLPRVVNKVSKLSEYIPSKIELFIDLDTIFLAYERIMEEVTEFKEEDIFDISSYMHDLKSIIPKKYVNVLSVDNYNKNDENVVENYFSTGIECFNGNYNKINAFLNKMLEDNKKIIVCLQDNNIIDEFISKSKINVVISDKNHLKENVVNVVKEKLSNGFIINNYVFLTSSEIYKENKIVNYKSRFRYGSKIKDINKLNPGDYVVHQTHGIGRYLGIVTLNVRGLKKDFIHLAYKDSDKLYIPVEKIEYISKYSSNEGVRPRLNKLGGTEWIKQKAKIRNKVKNIAKELLEVSAKRKLMPGFAFLQDDEEQLIFENKFSYEETEDQLKAIREIKEDMEEPFPMDRLLCGDVGYGKTEVAFRAIFKAIKSGKQACLLCPTTILSKQHYNNAQERFSSFGVNIEVLNRFVSDKKKKNILEGLKNGKIDLIIGTHRLLSNDVKFKDLGLLVIDEEQRFGVTHKEKIKKYKENVDVLTLSATPIPRTLQMSLTGIRELSLIETPPGFRYPVQTYVLRENDQVIKDAIYKELSRDGQVFFLYNNVSKIENQVFRIKKLIPEAKVCYVHGQMNKEKIERTMESFVNKEYDVLVCTTIIETGIDISNANTLIVLDADHFGLSQLYQIRGRIGRGRQIAYAYLMYNKSKELTDVAIKRLDAIKEFTELGSGYALAVRDLAIRGAGDVLGAEQSGFIDSVGYDMYLKILNEEVEKLKGNIDSDYKEEQTDERPFIEVSTHISDKYAESEELKIEIHKMINTIDSIDTFNKVKNELTDRFGKLDASIIIYMLEELFQEKAKKKGVFKVDQSLGAITVYFNKEVSKKQDGANVLSSLFKISNSFDVSYFNNILRITLKTKDLKEHYLYYLLKMLDVIE